jgi:NAD-dependent SIR2 family protein deacetylase
MKPKLVVLSGAGISLESGVSTLDESTGVWEGRHLMDVASEHGWRTHPGHLPNAALPPHRLTLTQRNCQQRL